MDRRFIFSYSEIVDYIQQNYVAFAGEEYRFKLNYPGWYERLKPLRAKDPRGYFADRPEHTNMQGHYQITAEGKPLGMWRGPHQIKGRAGCFNTMEESYKLFLASREKLETPSTEIAGGQANYPPENWFVMTAYSRPLDSNPRGYAGRAQLWMSPAEINEFAQRSEQMDNPFWMPKSFVMRLIKFGLVDNTFGWQQEWRAEDVRKAQISVRAVKFSGGVRTLVFGGPISLRKSGDLVGYDCELRGEMDVDLSQPFIQRFRAYAEGTAWGSQLSDDGQLRKPRFPLGIGIVETTDKTVMKLDMGNGQYVDPHEVSRVIP